MEVKRPEFFLSRLKRTNVVVVIVVVVVVATGVSFGKFPYAATYSKGRFAHREYRRLNGSTTKGAPVWITDTVGLYSSLSL